MWWNIGYVFMLKKKTFHCAYHQMGVYELKYFSRELWPTRICV